MTVALFECTFLSHFQPDQTFTDSYPCLDRTFTKAGDNFFQTSPDILAGRVDLMLMFKMLMALPKKVREDNRLLVVIWLLFMKLGSKNSSSLMSVESRRQRESNLYTLQRYGLRTRNYASTATAD